MRFIIQLINKREVAKHEVYQSYAENVIYDPRNRTRLSRYNQSFDARDFI